MSSTNLTVTLAHAIAYLTGPLLTTHSAAAIIKLQALLDANLVALYAPTWSVKEPLRGSARRAFVLSPACLPPRPIYAACIAAGVQWFDWIDALGGVEFEFYVDPGCVAVRRAGGKLTTVWSGNVAAPPLPTPRTGLASFSDAQNKLSSHKTVAQQLLEDDDEDEKIFDLINDANWGSGPAVPITRSSSPMSNFSSPYSRCSSRSSNSSSSDTYSNSSSPPSSHSSQSSKHSSSSRRDKSKHTRVFIDTTKTDVTPYDGGKTTVLTGGVMLGGGPTKAGAHKPKQSSSSWRSARA